MDEEFVAPVVPEEGGYVKSFTIDQGDEFEKFFWKFGFVVIRDAIPAAYVDATIDEIWKKHLPNVDRHDTSKYASINWKQIYGSAYNTKRGFLGYEPEITQTAWNNRQHPAVVEAFARIWGRKDLWVKLDRIGFMRPTRNINIDGEQTDKQDWETERHWVHWDQNPWMEKKFCRVQGLLTLSDHTETSGGFHCIPGFTPYFKTWANKQKFPSSDGLVDLPRDDPCHKFVKKITMKAGSLLIWDSRTPHGNYPNEGNQFRIVQYVTYFPAIQESSESRKQIMTFALMANYVPLTNLGKKVAGLIPYDSDEISSNIIQASVYNMDQWGM